MFSEAQEEPVGSMIKDLDGDGYMETFIRPYFYLFGPLGYARKRVDFDIRRGDIKTIGELRAELFPL